MVFHDNNTIHFITLTVFHDNDTIYFIPANFMVKDLQMPRENFTMK